MLDSGLVVSALAMTALEVSGTSWRDEIVLVTGVAGCAPPADASLTCPALIWTVFTLTGFIGSDEPGIAAIDWAWITPLVNGAGSDFVGCDAVAAAATVRGAAAAARAVGAATGSAETGAGCTAPWT